jgi:acyl-CoA thioesterase-1
MRTIFPNLKRGLRQIAMLIVLASMAPIGAAHAESALIVALGADNVAGYGAGKHSGGVPSDEAFPAQLETLLHTRGIDAHVLNAGVPGDTCPDILARTDAAVPDGTRLVIFDRPNGNDKKAGLYGNQQSCVDDITSRLSARHIAFFILPAWEDIPGTTDNRDMDGHHFTAQGHALIAAYLLPKVIAALGGH